MSSENTTPSHISAETDFTDSSRSVVTNFGQSSSTSTSATSEVVNHVTSIFVPGSDCVEFHTSASGGDVCSFLLCFVLFAGWSNYLLEMSIHVSFKSVDHPVTCSTTLTLVFLVCSGFPHLLTLVFPVFAYGNYLFQGFFHFFY